MKGAINIFSVVLLLCSGYNAVQAQEVYTSSGRSINQAKKDRKQKEKGFDKSKIIFGGGLGGGFDQFSASFSVTPVVGYRITDRFAMGVGLSYQYLRVKDFFVFSDSIYENSYPLKASIVAPSVWARYVVWRNIFAHVEYEHDFMSFNDYHQVYNNSTGRLDVVGDKIKYSAPCLLIGGGIRQPINDRISLVAILLYDVIQDKYSPYLNRVDLRIGVNVGF